MSCCSACRTDTHSCALIHRHRPELLDWDHLDKSDRRGNTALAFKIAEESLGIPVSDCLPTVADVSAYSKYRTYATLTFRMSALS